LNELAAISKDLERAFARAATDSKDPALIKVFGDSERSCRQAAAELQDEVRTLGGASAEEDGRREQALSRSSCCRQERRVGRESAPDGHRHHDSG
jgi:uncharacterized protein (TIGR02284 family)